MKHYFNYICANTSNMKQYIDLIEKIIKTGVQKSDRTGTGTISIFGHQSEYDLSKGFPLLTAKSTYYKGIFIELLWFLGIHLKDEKYSKLPMTNIKYLVDNNVNIWNEWAHKGMLKYQKETYEKILAENPTVKLTPLPEMSLKEFVEKIKEDKDGFAEKWGNLGSVYGKQWRKWQFTEISNGDQNSMQVQLGHIDQIQYVIDRLKTHPEDRGLIVSAWNVGELDQMALRPCHTMFQFYTQPLSYNERLNIHLQRVKSQGGFDTCDIKTEEKLDSKGIPKYKLSLQLYQRSADVFLGVPFNIASYALLLSMVAQVSNMVVDKFVHTFGDAHIYVNHMSQVNQLLKQITPNITSDVDFWDKNFNSTIGYEWPELPQLELNQEIKNIFDFTMNDIKIVNYKPLPKISAPIAI